MEALVQECILYMEFNNAQEPEECMEEGEVTESVKVLKRVWYII
jgi:hypothetical protein